MNASKHTTTRLPDTLTDNRLVRRFDDLRREGRKAFIPFVTACDPDTDTTVELVLGMEKAGASVVELGVAFSDPIADGPTIQTAFTRVLAKGFEAAQAFDAVKRIRERSEIPIALMLSCSIVTRIGTETFVKRCARAGVDGLIVPDLPVEAAAELRRAAKEHGIALTFLVTPATPDARVERIVEASTGFVYYVSVMGVTGARADLPKAVSHAVRHLKTMTDRPVCIGFGISTPEHVKALGQHADGVIVGSALVKRMTEAIEKGKSPVRPVTAAVKELSGAL
jgi:tryptophan synthase alpha chain